MSKREQAESERMLRRSADQWGGWRKTEIRGKSLLSLSSNEK
jgi:hypothetical protein